LKGRIIIMKTKTALRWQRKSPNSNNNFDLILISPEEADVPALSAILDSIIAVQHRGLTLNSAATQTFRDWLDNPSEPLKSLAYVSLSNWFLTNGGDRHSEVAICCERLWDALFACRPERRLSSSLRAQNQRMLPEEFARFWPRLMAAQNDDSTTAQGNAIRPSVPSGGSGKEVISGSLHATFVKAGMKCELEGSPEAIARFMEIASNWEQSAS